MTKKNSTVFIIDDNKLFSFLLKTEMETLLQGKNFEVFAFEDGEAIENMLHMKPDLVIVDYHLDGKKESAKNGLEIIDLIKKESPETDFIMVTMDEHTELFLRSKQYNIYDYLTKGPITLYKLGLSIDRWLKLKN